MMSRVPGSFRFYGAGRSAVNTPSRRSSNHIGAAVQSVEISVGTAEGRPRPGCLQMLRGLHGDEH